MLHLSYKNETEITCKKSYINCLNFEYSNLKIHGRMIYAIVLKSQDDFVHIPFMREFNLDIEDFIEEFYNIKENLEFVEDILPTLCSGNENTDTLTIFNVSLPYSAYEDILEIIQTQARLFLKQIFDKYPKLNLKI